MLWLIMLGVAYCTIGALTGGYIHQYKNRPKATYEGRWGNDDSAFVGAGWPISMVWYLVLKPLARAGHYLGERQQTRVERLKRIREELEAVERTRQLEIQKHMRELEAEEAEYQAQHQASA